MLREYISWPTTILLLVAIGALLYLAWRSRRSRTPIRLHIKDWVRIDAPRWTLLLGCALAILWGVHRGAHEWARAKLEIRPESAGRTKPRFATQDEWVCARAIAAYNNREYNVALRHFAKIGNLSGPSYVRWKFYEAMAFFRKEQYRKAVLLDAPSLDAVDSAIVRLRTIVDQHKNDILYADAKYWYAQCLRYLVGDGEEALRILRELLNENIENPNYRWREGSMYYSAILLLDRGDSASRIEAVELLRELLSKYPTGLIQSIELGRDTYTVRWVVGTLARERGIENLLKQ